jgi:hypothetical protein
LTEIHVCVDIGSGGSCVNVGSAAAETAPTDDSQFVAKGPVYELTITAESASVTAAHLGGPVCALLSCDTDAFWACGSAGIDPRPPGSGGVGRPLWAKGYRHSWIGSGDVVAAIADQMEGRFFVEIVSSMDIWP